MYIPQHFTIQELVPRHVYEDRGEAAWELLDDRLLLTLDTLRDEFGPVIVNTWHSRELQKRYGLRGWSGLRTEKSPYGSMYSQHRFGRAVDCLFVYGLADDVRTAVLENRDKFPFINAIELEVKWFHCDTRNCKRIKTFLP